MAKLKIGLLQLNIVWENIEENLKKVDKILSDKVGCLDILVLPEMFATGFTMNVSSCAQTMNDSIIHWMKDRSKQWNCAIMGSVAIKENGAYYNRLLMVNNEDIQFYDKRHLFSMGQEHEYYTPGQKTTLFHYKSIIIQPAVCYDLRFPVWLRNTTSYDLMICVANWPKPRTQVWSSLLVARAIENQSYVVGVNRSGEGGGLSYNGQSLVIDAKGNLIDTLDDEMDGFKVVTIDFDEQNIFRKKFPVLQDADTFTLKN